MLGKYIAVAVISALSVSALPLPKAQADTGSDYNDDNGGTLEMLVSTERSRTDTDITRRQRKWSPQWQFVSQIPASLVIAN